MTQSLNEWVRIGDAARATGIPVSTLRRWAKAGRIRCAQVGGERTWLFLYLPSLALPPDAAGTATPAGVSSKNSTTTPGLRFPPSPAGRRRVTPASASR